MHVHQLHLSRISLYPQQDTAKMLASRLTPRLARRYVCAQCRSFSSSKASLAAAQAAEIKKLGVVGAGQMGLGIALVAARIAQVPVTVVDNSQKSLDKGLAFAGIAPPSGSTSSRDRN